MNQFKLFVLFFMLLPCPMKAQTVNTFEGMDSTQLSNPEHDVDPNGSVGTKQFVEWVNVAFQAYDKVNFAPVWPTPQAGSSPWQNNGIQGCNIAGDGVILFDHLASRWVIAGHNSPGLNGPYYYCVAVSSTDDLTSSSLSWYTYQFPLNPVIGSNGIHPYFPDWPKLGAWSNSYYVSFDLMDVDNHFQIIGVAVCALDRSDMLTGTPQSQLRPMQCFADPNPIPGAGAPLYLKHSLSPADVEGTTPLPAGLDEFMVSIQNPPLDGQTTTSTTINLWDLHLDWINPANSTFTNSPLTVPTYTPGCYTAIRPKNTACVLEPATNSAGRHYVVDSVGDRLMPRFTYRNFGSYQSFLVSHTVRVGTGRNVQTAIRWYELRGATTPTLFQSRTFSPDLTTFRFMPSIAQDHVGNAAVGYSVSGAKIHPGIRAASWNLPKRTKPVEVHIQDGSGDAEDSNLWGDYTSMTVDPVDDCTFWYVNEYQQSNESNGVVNWNTRIANFAVPGCAAGLKTSRNPIGSAARIGGRVAK